MSEPQDPVGGGSRDQALVHTANPAIGGRDRMHAAVAVGKLLAPAFVAGRAPDSGSGSLPPIAVVDVGANPLDDDAAPYQLLLDAGLARITGFEPQPAALAELHRRAGPHEQYLPYAVGDGERHLLRWCESPGFASLLEPDAAQLALLVDFPALAAVVDRQPIDTRRLDDIVEIDRIDLLKIDIQGGELSVLRAGRTVLADAVAVQTEVGFHRLYLDQPTFAEVDTELRDQGFVPHQFVSTRTWPLSPVPWADPLQQASRHLIEADMLYVRDPVHLELLTDAQLGRFALVADVGYGSFGLALRCVIALVARDVLEPAAEGSYRALATARLTPSTP